MPAMKTNPKEASRFFLIIAAIFGLFVRIFPVLNADFPLVDGGMFYSMIRNLQASNFILPIYTTYNHADIPFAYPPLAFYVAGGINTLTGISLLDVIKWLPVIVSVLTIPFFYYFTKLILHSEPAAALATLLYCLTPNSYWWNIVGGGLTRSTGTLFFIITNISLYQLYRTKKSIWIIGAILGGTLVVLSHPAWSLQTAASAFLMFLFWGRGRSDIRNSMVVGCGILLLTSPWWMTVISNHGIATLFFASAVTHPRWLFWTILFALSFTGEYTTVIAVFSMAGFFIYLARKSYFLPAWALLCLFIDPRGGLPASIFPFSIMAASIFTDSISPLLGGEIDQNHNSDGWIHSLDTKIGRLFFGFFIILFLYNAYTVSNTLSLQHLGKMELDSFQWVKSNTNIKDNFLIFDEQSNPLLSALSEWFPALTDRRNVTTIQGTEWLPGNLHYNKQIPIITGLHECINQSINCLDRFDLGQYSYILISSAYSSPLTISLENDPRWIQVYSNLTIKIFSLKSISTVQNNYHPTSHQ